MLTLFLAIIKSQTVYKALDSCMGVEITGIPEILAGMEANTVGFIVNIGKPK